MRIQSLARDSIVIFGVLTVLTQCGCVESRANSNFRSKSDTELEIILWPSQNTVSMFDTLRIRLLILNPGLTPQKREIYILGRLWGADSINVVYHWVAEDGKPVEFLKDSNHAILGKRPPPSTVCLYIGEFWGTTLTWPAASFPKSGSYYLEVTYYGTSSTMIEELIDAKYFKRKDLRVSAERYWHGEVKSNKIKIVVKK